MHAYIYTMSSAETSVRISRHTLSDLSGLQKVWQTKSADETIRKLIKERRSKALESIRGTGRSLPPFAEADRLESHH
jgi:hypothetical protein